MFSRNFSGYRHRSAFTGRLRP